MAYLCHCQDCRRFTGTSFHHNATFDEKDVKITKPEKADLDKVLTVWGDDGTRQFCSKCGSGLFLTVGSKVESMAGKIIVTVGTIDEGESNPALKPSMEGFCKRREPWMKGVEGAMELQEWG